MTGSEKKQALAAVDEEMLFADGFDDAIIGYIARCGQPPIVIYDRTKCIALMEKKGMSFEESEEYFSFNTEGAWVGPRTPGYLVRVEDIEDVIP